MAVVLVAAHAGAGCGEGDDPEPAATTTTGDSGDGVSPLRVRFDRQVRELLTERGLDPAVIDCSLERMQETVSDAQVESAAEEIKETGVPPAAVIDAAAEAGEQCAGD